MEKKNVPQLRFKEFEDEWEEKALGECFTERNERSSEGDLISVTINNGIKKADELERFVHIADKSNYKVVKKGDIAYNTMRMWQGASGYSPYSGILSPAYTVLCPNENTDSLFHSYLFKKPDMIHLFEINSQGLTSDTWNLKYDAFSEIRTNITSKIEQQKIGSFLSDIDSLIQTKTKKLEILKSVKKSLLQKCFPKNGEKVPQMRFDGFTSDWEEKKLGDLIVEINERTSDFNKYKLFSLTIENGVTKKTERYERGFLVTKDEDLFKIVHTNNFVTNPMNFRFGAIGYSKEVNDISVSGYYDVFSIENNTSSNFWYYYFKTDSSLKRFDDVATGSLIEKRRVKLSTLKQMSFISPSKEEQQKIGQFFSKYDSLISLQQKEIENLKTIKKSLLQKMFV